MNKDIQAIALRTINMETKAIEGLQHFINDDFVNAVKTIHQCAGRLVLSGIGKSAIVGQKIAATLNSTGTPSLFMHAADAIHGDIGMVQQQDVVMIISKSGESNEIKTLLPLIKRMNNTIIAMTGNTQSYLAQHAAIIINTSVETEACPNNLSPTSSTTAQMVMGDALAICLMELNEFTQQDFAKYHPGGNLGKRLYLSVDDVYKQNAKPQVHTNTPLKNIIFEITKGRLGATAVTDEDGHLLGIITDGDVRRLLEKTDDIRNIIAKDIVNIQPKKIQPDMLAVQALEIMNTNGISQLIITNEQNKYLGILHLHDLIKEGIF